MPVESLTITGEMDAHDFFLDAHGVRQFAFGEAIVPSLARIVATSCCKLMTFERYVSWSPADLSGHCTAEPKNLLANAQYREQGEIL